MLRYCPLIASSNKVVEDFGKNKYFWGVRVNQQFIFDDKGVSRPTGVPNLLCTPTRPRLCPGRDSAGDCLPYF